MSHTKKNQEVDLKIDGMSRQGNGVGTLVKENGKDSEVEVPFTMPGDQVRAQLLRKRGDSYKSRLREVIAPSSERVQPRCPHFGVCGGCRLQHFSYEHQLQYKESVIRECFAPVLNSQVDLQPIIPCKSLWHYRNKMEYTFSSDSSGKKYLGLIMDGGQGHVFNLSECYLPNPWFVTAVKSIREWWYESGLEAYFPTQDKGSLRTLTLREGVRSGDRMVILTVSGNPTYALQKHHIDSFVAFMRDSVDPTSPNSQLSIVLRIQQIQKGMATSMYEMVLHGPGQIRETFNIDVPPHPPKSLKFNISPSAFFQPNTDQGEKLCETAIRLSKVNKDTVVYDLYCGTGVLGICFSKFVKQVVGVELSPEASLDAITNSKQNNCSNVTILSNSVRYLGDALGTQEFPKPDLIILDPPRSGLDEGAFENVLRLNSPQILYMSCNPATQAKNVIDFVSRGYRLMTIQPVDQFPHTYHIENTVLLKKD